MKIEIGQVLKFDGWCCVVVGKKTETGEVIRLKILNDSKVYCQHCGKASSAGFGDRWISRGLLESKAQPVSTVELDSDPEP